jgi:hypothetical protein
MENQNTTTPTLSAPKPQLSKAQQAIGVAAFVLLFISLFFGYRSGVARARSLDTYHSVDTLNTALGYYFKDQSEYPTQQQFQNQQILTINYLTTQPQPSDVSGACANDTTFDYSRPTAQTFQLQFCLQQGVKGLSVGEHVLTPSGVR